MTTIFGHGNRVIHDTIQRLRDEVGEYEAANTDKRIKLHILRDEFPVRQHLPSNERDAHYSNLVGETVDADINLTPREKFFLDRLDRVTKMVEDSSLGDGLSRDCAELRNRVNRSAESLREEREACKATVAPASSWIEKILHGFSKKKLKEETGVVTTPQIIEERSTTPAPRDQATPSPAPTGPGLSASDSRETNSD